MISHTVTGSEPEPPVSSRLAANAVGPQPHSGICVVYPMAQQTGLEPATRVLPRHPLSRRAGYQLPHCCMLATGEGLEPSRAFRAPPVFGTGWLPVTAPCQMAKRGGLEPPDRTLDPVARLAGECLTDWAPSLHILITDSIITQAHRKSFRCTSCQGSI